MSTEKDYEDLVDRLAALREKVTRSLASQLSVDPQLADAVNRQIEEMQATLDRADMAQAPPADGGLAQLTGLGPEAATLLGQTRLPRGIVEYDNTMPSERANVVAFLYYGYQHERIGVFKVVQKLQELFQQGAVRLSDGRCAQPAQWGGRWRHCRSWGRTRAAGSRRRSACPARTARPGW